MSAPDPERPMRATPDDTDADGMPDAWNARMPAIAFMASMLALIPVLFGMRGAIRVFQHTGSRGAAFAWNIVGVVFAALSIVAAAFGARAKTKSLATAANWIGVLEIVICITFIVAMFFAKA